MIVLIINTFDKMEGATLVGIYFD